MEVVNDKVCLVCGARMDDCIICPDCGYEHHEWIEPSDKVKEFEEKRLSQAKEAWNRLQEQKHSVTRNMPMGFLVTENFVVYCIYEGTCSFGSSKVVDNDGMHQKLIIPGCNLKPVHFCVETSKGERISTFRISEAGDGTEPSVFVNSKTEPVRGVTEIHDGDDILISAGNVTSVLKFRINLNTK